MAGLASFAIGTDSGGSVRIPAAFCGVVGFRPSPAAGGWETDGVVPLSPTFDTLGPICSSAEDMLLLTMAMQTACQARSTEALANLSLRNTCEWRCGVLAPAQREGVETAQLERYDAACEMLRGMGACIVPLDLPKRRGSGGGRWCEMDIWAYIQRNIYTYIYIYIYMYIYAYKK